jgi:hypothetical protein|tara:strand:+ start:113 stop:307 length:195 start_codon:yes stop_codon:yes gene_type:complete
MKNGKTVSKHDIIREIKGINERLDYMFSGLSLLSTSLNDYVDFSKNEKKFVKYLKKKYGDTIEE